MLDSCMIIVTMMFPYAFTLSLNSPHPHPHPWRYPYPRFSNAEADRVTIEMRHSNNFTHEPLWVVTQMLACVLSVLFTPLGDMISLMKSSFPSTLFCVFGCIFHLGVVLDTEIWGS